MKIMLIIPPFYRLYGDDSWDASHNVYPLGVGYLAAMIVARTDWECQVVNGDAKFDNDLYFNMPLIRMAGDGFKSYLGTLDDPSAPIWREIEETIRSFDPDVIGLSATSQSWRSATMIAGIAKRINARTLIIAGGPHSSMSGAKVLDCPHIDINVVGEGEETIVDILSAFQENKSFEGVAGISYRDGAGRVATTAPRPFVAELDTLPFPVSAARQTLKDFNKYPTEAFRSMFAIRGCPYFCQFCGSRTIWSRKARFRSPENVIAEIKELAKLGIHHIHFEDDMFGIKTQYIENLCSLMKQDCPDMTFSCEMTVTTINDDNLSAMKEGGCIAVSFGVESGNNEMLKTIRKIQTIEGAYEAADLLRKYDIKASTFFMIGFPEETEETLADTVKAMEEINTDNIIFSIFTPYPDTEMFHICKEKGLIPDIYDVSLYNHQSLENCFTENISPDRFRELATDCLKRVDALNEQRRQDYDRRVRQRAEEEFNRKMERLGAERRHTEAVKERILMRLRAHERIEGIQELWIAFRRYLKIYGIGFTGRKVAGYLTRKITTRSKSDFYAPSRSDVNTTGPTYYQDHPDP